MRTDVENIIELLGPREVITQAIHVLMATQDVSREAAIRQLFEGSYESHRAVREIAGAIILQRRGD
jgi:AmiR/NasT family two-component response regulator